MWMRGSSNGDQIEVTIDFRDQKMWTAPLQSTTEIKTLTTDWQEYSITARAPTGTAKPVCHLRVTFEAAAGDTVHVDDVAVQTRGGTGYCYGDGTGQSCPCGNLGGECAGCANSSAEGAILVAIGDAVIGADTAVLSVSQCPAGVPGLFFSGSNALGGSPFGDGLRCVGGGLTRLQVIFTDVAGGGVSTIQLSVREGLIGGELRNYQYWYRDVPGPCTSGFNTSNACSIQW